MQTVLSAYAGRTFPQASAGKSRLFEVPGSVQAASGDIFFGRKLRPVRLLSREDLAAHRKKYAPEFEKDSIRREAKQLRLNLLSSTRLQSDRSDSDEVLEWLVLICREAKARKINPALLAALGDALGWYPELDMNAGGNIGLLGVNASDALLNDHVSPKKLHEPEANIHAAARQLQRYLDEYPLEKWALMAYFSDQMNLAKYMLHESLPGKAVSAELGDEEKARRYQNWQGMQAVDRLANRILQTAREIGLAQVSAEHPESGALLAVLRRSRPLDQAYAKLVMPVLDSLLCKKTMDIPDLISAVARLTEDLVAARTARIFEAHYGALSEREARAAAIRQIEPPDDEAVREAIRRFDAYLLKYQDERYALMALMLKPGELEQFVFNPEAADRRLVVRMERARRVARAAIDETGLSPRQPDGMRDYRLLYNHFAIIMRHRDESPVN